MDADHLVQNNNIIEYQDEFVNNQYSILGTLDAKHDFGDPVRAPGIKPVVNDILFGARNLQLPKIIKDIPTEPPDEKDFSFTANTLHPMVEQFSTTNAGDDINISLTTMSQQQLPIPSYTFQNLKATPVIKAINLNKYPLTDERVIQILLNSKDPTADEIDKIKTFLENFPIFSIPNQTYVCDATSLGKDKMYDKLFPNGLSRNYLSDNFDPATSKSASIKPHNNIEYKIPFLISEDIKIYIKIWKTNDVYVKFKFIRELPAPIIESSLVAIMFNNFVPGVYNIDRYITNKYNPNTGSAIISTLSAIYNYIITSKNQQNYDDYFDIIKERFNSIIAKYPILINY